MFIIQFCVRVCVWSVISILCIQAPGLIGLIYWMNSFSLNLSKVLFCPLGWGSITWSPSQGPAEGFAPAVCACSVAQLCLTLCDPMDCSPPSSSVHGISQARILEWVATSSFSLSSWLRIQPASLALADGFFTAEPLGSPMLMLKYISSACLEKEDAGVGRCCMLS